MSVISKENMKKLAEFIDELVKFKNPVLETADGWAFKMVLGVIDDNALSKIKPEFHPLIDKVASQIGDKNFEGAAETLGEIAAMAVNTPLIDGTETETELYRNAFKTIAQLIQTFVEKKQM